MATEKQQFKSAKIKQLDDEGEGQAVIATLNVIDKDGDVTLPGFFGEQESPLLPAHDWQHVPLGKGTVHEQGDEALFDFKMNLDVPAARDWHSALKWDLKNEPPLQEYSYGFRIGPGGHSFGEFNGQEVRFLQPTPEGKAGARVFEVSPVLVGAGEGTRTLALKNDQSMRYKDQAEMVRDAIDALIARTKELASLRAKDGRQLSDEHCQRLVEMAKGLRELEPLAKDLEELAGAASEADDPDTKSELQRELLRFEAVRAGVTMGGTQ